MKNTHFANSLKVFGFFGLFAIKALESSVWTKNLTVDLVETVLDVKIFEKESYDESNAFLRLLHRRPLRQGSTTVTSTPS